MKTATVDLTKSETENLIEFFDLCFVDFIRNDRSIDNMGYIAEMGDVYKKLLAAKEQINEAEV